MDTLVDLPSQEGRTFLRNNDAQICDLVHTINFLALQFPT